MKSKLGMLTSYPHIKVHTRKDSGQFIRLPFQARSMTLFFLWVIHTVHIVHACLLSSIVQGRF